MAEPYSGCSEITNAEYVQGHIALLQRGQCMFAEKARNVQKAGAIGGIVIGEYRHMTNDDNSVMRLRPDNEIILRRGGGEKCGANHQVMDCAI